MTLALLLIALAPQLAVQYDTTPPVLIVHADGTYDAYDTVSPDPDVDINDRLSGVSGLLGVTVEDRCDVTTYTATDYATNETWAEQHRHAPHLPICWPSVAAALVFFGVMDIRKGWRR